MGLQFHAVVTKIGKFAKDSLADDMLILFGQNAPEYVADYCFIHDMAITEGVITTESTLLISNEYYIVTAVGETANKNLRELGHITIKFNAMMKPEFPGTVHVIGHCPASIDLGENITFG